MARGPSPSKLWDHFHRGPKINLRHFRAICRGCVKHYLENPKPSNSDAADSPEGSEASDSDSNDGLDKKSVEFRKACADAGSVNGEKNAMVAHILGQRAPHATPACAYATAEARSLAEEIRGAGVKRGHDSDDESARLAPATKKRASTTPTASSSKSTTAPPKPKFKQGAITTYKANDLPFSASAKAEIEAQAARATISANLPFRWIDNTEVRKLFYLFRSKADDVLPSRHLLSGRLLDDQHEIGEAELKELLPGKSVGMSTDGWKDDIGKESVTGVVISYKFISYLADVIASTSHKKDAMAMCDAFERMIDKAERDFLCIVRLFLTDGDGGLAGGRRELVRRRPWIIAPTCWAHQCQLILLDYLAENPEAEEAAELLASVNGWLYNHLRVRALFNAAQAALENGTGHVYAYLLANTTRWTTHFIAFQRVLKLKDVLRHTAIAQRAAIVDAQVGAAKGKKKRELASAAEEMCDVLDDPKWWKTLRTAADDFEPICLGVNINQSDTVRLDQVLLSLAGMYLHFKAHANPSIRKGMMRRIEARWKAAGNDQALFLIATVLNPYEKLAPFGAKAGLNAFTLNTAFVDLFMRVESRPLPDNLSDEEREEARTALLLRREYISRGFFRYLNGVGVFADFEENKETWKATIGDDPAMVWESMLDDPQAHELAVFAIWLLQVVANQGANERNFSDFKITKTRLRNRLGLKKLEKMTKVNDRIRREGLADGTRKERQKRSIHEKDRARELLDVPRYADALESMEGEELGTGDGTAPPGRTRARASCQGDTD
ncbi:hypothetical protein EXIGLDRAFT_765262 [Exidia glandulosa HHB12029]|uniref:DUF659 domain-containing protein n=1 Tax=Exidia glandulosa HHB12029 TaxID=1314781 RepID=A0A165KN59_EXIGL|nr:hypothetical protein EXIGLDRAFT_765262 [Exidia glandulosa HHB12029]